MLRKILVYACFACFYLLLFIFNNLFLVEKFNLLSILFTIIIIFASNYVVEFFEGIYDKFILKKIKRSNDFGNEK